MKSYKGKIAECWEPTFENVTREFITETLYKILFSEDLPNFRIEFREKEAIEYIETILKKYTEKYGFYKQNSQKILQSIKKENNENTETPIMIVNNYKKFFELLRQFYEKDIELYFLRTEMPGFPRYEKDNFFEQIWLRATPDDFNNPEEFLEKQVKMINDTTFEKYDEEVCLGKIDFLNNNVLCVKNSIARTWDENSRQIELTIYDKNYYDNKEFFKRQQYNLPVIRYGIYEKNGKKVCCIGSIQDKHYIYEQSKLDKRINRKRYKVNEGIATEDTCKVEPKNIIALSIFINLLHKEDITEIEVPSLYVLDYEYHTKRNKVMLEDFEKEWTGQKIKRYPEVYQKALYHFKRNYQKQDLISEIKTERMILTFRRLLQHYPEGSIKSYPWDIDSYMHLDIPMVKNENDINGSILQELYKLSKTLESEREI